MKYINCANLSQDTADFLLNHLPTDSVLTRARIRYLIVENADWSSYDEVPPEVAQMLRANAELSKYVVNSCEMFKLTYDENSTTVIYEDSK